MNLYNNNNRIIDNYYFKRIVSGLPLLIVRSNVFSGCYQIKKKKKII